jgi:hypothetical protein
MRLAGAFRVGLKSELTSSNLAETAAHDQERTSSSSQQHRCEGIIGRAFGLRRRLARFRHPMNSMTSRVRPNCRFGQSHWALDKCNAADRQYCEGEKSASRFVNGHFDSPYTVTFYGSLLFDE